MDFELLDPLPVSPVKEALMSRTLRRLALTAVAAIALTTVACANPVGPQLDLDQVDSPQLDETGTQGSGT